MQRKNNLINDITAYIKKNLKKGYTKESLRWALVNQGYSQLEIERAIKKVDEQMASEAPILKTKPQIRYEIIEPETVIEPEPKGWKRFFGL